MSTVRQPTVASLVDPREPIHVRVPVGPHLRPHDLAAADRSCSPSRRETGHCLQAPPRGRRAVPRRGDGHRHVAVAHGHPDPIGQECDGDREAGSRMGNGVCGELTQDCGGLADELVAVPQLQRVGEEPARRSSRPRLAPKT
jgi:hypothetical protein